MVHLGDGTEAVAAVSRRRGPAADRRSRVGGGRLAHYLAPTSDPVGDGPGGDQTEPRIHPGQRRDETAAAAAVQSSRREECP